MLKIQGLSKQYAKVMAVQDASLHVAPGTVAVLVGPNGAGKSTLIKSVTGLLRFRGEILIDQHPNKSLHAKAALGYVPEIPAIYDLLTVKEHLDFIARAYKLQEGWQQRADSLLQRLELHDKQDKLGKELSKGMQQKLSIACALLPQPKVVIMDEPLVGLDPHAIKELKEIIKALKDSGSAVLISTHMLDSVQQLWDEAFVMMKGQIVASLRRSEADEADRSLEEMFFRVTEGKEAAQ